jgi:hypothetical protein
MVHESMQDAVVSIEAVEEPLDQAGVATLVQKKHGMSHQIRDLEQSSVCCTREVRDVREIVKHPPSRSQFSEPAHPYPGPLVKATLGKDQ